MSDLVAEIERLDREGKLSEYTKKHLGREEYGELLTGKEAIDALYDEHIEDLKHGIDTKEVVDILADFVRKNLIVVFKRGGRLYPTRTTMVLGLEKEGGEKL